MEKELRISYDEFQTLEKERDMYKLISENLNKALKSKSNIVLVDFTGGLRHIINLKGRLENPKISIGKELVKQQLPELLKSYDSPYDSERLNKKITKLSNEVNRLRENESKQKIVKESTWIRTGFIILLILNIFYIIFKALS